MMNVKSNEFTASDYKVYPSNSVIQARAGSPFSGWENQPAARM